MGLDIRTKNDYARFNWSGAGDFRRWSLEHLEKDPFPYWNGGNGTVIILDDRDISDDNYGIEVKGNTQEYQDWCNALEKYCKKIKDNIIEKGKGEIVGEIAYRVNDMAFSKYGENDSPMREELVEWCYIQAIKWYFVVQDALECGSISYF